MNKNVYITPDIATGSLQPATHSGVCSLHSDTDINACNLISHISISGLN